MGLDNPPPVAVVLGGIVLGVLLAALGLDRSSEGFTMSVANIEFGRDPVFPEGIFTGADSTPPGRIKSFTELL